MLKLEMPLDEIGDVFITSEDANNCSVAIDSRVTGGRDEVFIFPLPIDQVVCKLIYLLNYAVPVSYPPLEPGVVDVMDSAVADRWLSLIAVARVLYSDDAAREIWKNSPLPDVDGEGIGGDGLSDFWQNYIHLMSVGDSEADIIYSSYVDQCKARDLDQEIVLSRSAFWGKTLRMAEAG